MRLRTLINRLVWLVVIAFLGYAALLAASSYLQVKETVDQAVTDSVQRQKAAVATGRPTAAPQDQAVDVKAAILLTARRADLPVGVTKVVVKAGGRSSSGIASLVVRRVDRGGGGGPRGSALDGPNV
jgi:hypothetical protein